jgi:flagellar hook-associated protein 3 FlgL
VQPAQTPDVFTIAPSSSQSVFKSLANLIKTLESSATLLPADTAKYSNEIGFALNNLDKANDNILRVRAMIGSRMAELESLDSVNQDLTLQYQQTLSNLQDLDYAKTISDMTRKQTDLEAAQKSFMQTSQLSLFNYL